MDERKKYFLRPGYVFVSGEAYLVYTVLGSCVSVCLWDRVLNIGGLNHYICSTPTGEDQSGRYGNISTPYLIKLMNDMGASRDNLDAYIIGGARNDSECSIKVGQENIIVAEDILRKYGINVIRRDVGGEMARKVIFDTRTGEVLVCKLSNARVVGLHEEN